MNRTMLLATVALLGLAGAASAGPTLTPPQFCSKLPPLYDQTHSDSGIAIVSQNFESSFDNYDSQAADDFLVPKPGWLIREVYVTGTYFDGTGLARDETVIFYRNDHGLPGEEVARVTAQGLDEHFGSVFCIRLENGVMLRKGHYWVSVIANMDFLSGGEWGWENGTVQVLSPAAWRNPGGGFQVCPEWTVETVCIPNGQGDHVFALK